MTNHQAAGQVWHNSGVINNFSGQVNVGQAVFGIHSRTGADEMLHRLTALRDRLGDRPAAAIVDGIAAELQQPNPVQDRVRHLLDLLAAEVAGDDRLSADVAELTARFTALGD